MYKLEFLPKAKEDIDNIIYYVSNNLKNKQAAINLANKFIEGAHSLLVFPYGLPLLETTRKLKNEYRYLKIKSFIMFYIIGESNNTITIVRIIYEKMDINNIILKNK